MCDYVHMEVVDMVDKLLSCEQYYRDNPDKPTCDKLLKTHIILKSEFGGKPLTKSVTWVHVGQPGLALYSSCVHACCKSSFFMFLIGTNQ